MEFLYAGIYCISGRSKDQKSVISICFDVLVIKLSDNY